MKKVYLLPVVLFWGCIPDDFNIDDNIYNSNLEKCGYYCTKGNEAKNLSCHLNQKNESLEAVNQNLA